MAVLRCPEGDRPEISGQELDQPFRNIHLTIRTNKNTEKAVWEGIILGCARPDLSPKLNPQMMLTLTTMDINERLN